MEKPALQSSVRLKSVCLYTTPRTARAEVGTDMGADMGAYIGADMEADLVLKIV